MVRDRLRFAIALSIVAAGAASFAVALRSSLALWYSTIFQSSNVVEAIATLPRWLRFAVPALGGMVAGVISRWRAAPGQGVSNVMEAVVLGNLRLSFRTTISRVCASWAAIAAGMSIGREGPLVEFGGSAGAWVGRVAGTSTDQTRVLVAAGTAAGFAAAYNTPFAAILFVFETILGIAALDALLPTMIATVVATMLTRAVVGAGPIYGQRSFQLDAYSDLVWFVLLGGLAAVVAFGSKRTLRFLENWFERHPIAQPWRAAAGGAVVGAVAVWIPEVTGNGYEPLNLILDQRMIAGTIAVLIIAKIVATSASVGSGVPGGIFTPTLLVGAGLGSLLARVVASMAPSFHPNPGSYALVGMAAATAASIHAPLTAAVLVFELSGDYPIVLPLLLATATATTFSRALGSESVYEAELRRKGLAWQVTLEGRRMGHS